MRSLVFLCSLFFLFGGLAVAQDGPKPWIEWSKKEAEKMLNGSAWGQTQTERGPDPTDTQVTTATQGGRGATDKKGESGETMGPKVTNYRVRLLTAKPIREAFARLVVLSQENATKEFTDQMQGFVDRDFGDFLVITLSIEGSDAKATAAAMKGLSRLTAEMIKEKAYLERKDGKRAAFLDYKAPIADNLGAKFVFSRTLDGQPFLNEGSESLRFFVELSEQSKLNVKFKVSTMMYGGKLEY